MERGRASPTNRVPWSVAWRRAAHLAAGLSVCAGLALTGCWDRTEVNDLALVSGAAFDAAPNGGFQVTLSIILPGGIPSPGGGGGGGGGGGPTTMVISATGPSVSEAVASILQEEVPAQIFWGHTEVVIIGGVLAERGITPVLDFLMRDRTTRLLTEVVVTRGRAGPLLLTSPPSRSISTASMFENLRLRLMPKTPVYRIAEDDLRYGLGAAIPEVELAHPSPAGAQGAGGGGAGGGGGGQGSQTAVSPTVFDIGGVGLFQDGHLSGWMSNRAARGAMWLLGEATRGTVSFQTPQGVRVTMELESAKIRRRAILQNGGPAIRIQIQARDSLTEVSGPLKLDEPKTLAELNDLLDADLSGRARLALGEAQQLKVDPFQFGRLVAAYQPKVWKKVYRDWPDVFAQIPVILDVNSTVERTGNLISPVTRGGG